MPFHLLDGEFEVRKRTFVDSYRCNVVSSVPSDRRRVGSRCHSSVSRPHIENYDIDFVNATFGLVLKHVMGDRHSRRAL